MTEKQDEWVIVATFKNETAAERAIKGLKDWDRASDEIKLEAVGRIYKKDGQVKTGLERKTGKGAKVGAVLGIAAAVLTGGVTLAAGVVTGGVLGGAAGSFFKKSLHLTTGEVQAIGAELDAGRVAVVVACQEAEVRPASVQLIGSGGTVKTYLVPPGLLTETAAAIEKAAPKAPAK